MSRRDVSHVVSTRGSTSVRLAAAKIVTRVLAADSPRPDSLELEVPVAGFVVTDFPGPHPPQKLAHASTLH